MSNNSFKLALLRSTMIAGLAFAAAPALAQDAVADQDAAQNTQPGDTADDLGNTGQNTPQGVTPQEGAPAEEASTGEIVVTGTLIRNPNLESTAPVTVVGEDEIDLQQASVAEELLRELPGVVPSVGSAVNNGNGGASFVNLRGLGSNRNIVLIDGVRLVPAELQGRFDLNNIPVALVERVDVLTGGASTTYGADAVSGVVNFITRSDFAGLDVNAANTITERGDGNIFRIDATIGANFEDGRGNVVFSVGYQQADAVFQGARRVSVNQIDSFTGGIGGSGTSFPTRFTGVNPTRGDNANGTRQINEAFTAFNTTAAFTPFNFNPFNVFQTPFERYNIYGAGSYEVADGIEVYARGLFSKNTVSTVIAPSGAFNLPVDINLNNPFLTPAVRNAFCAADTNPATGAYTPRFDQATCDAAAVATGPTDPRYRTVTSGLFRRAVEAGPRISDFDTTIFDQRVGIRGDITDNLQFDVFGAYGESENTQTQQGYFLNSRVRQSLLVNNVGGVPTCQDPSNGCVPANFFGAISPEAVDFLTEDSTSATEITQALARGVISGDFGFASPFAEDDDVIGFAVGTEFREQNARISSDTLSQSGDLGGAGGAAPNVEGGFKVYEAFAELIAPLVTDKPFFENLQLEAGIRYSDYKIDAPGNPSFSTTTYKVGGRYEPGGGLQFRGFYARAVRAPNINELFSPVNTTLTNLADDPCASLNDAGQRIRQAPTGTLRDVCLAQGATQLTIGAIPQPVSGQANSTGGGNLGVGPEKSNSYTLGAVFQPEFIRNLAITVDYYNIKVSGAITNPAPGDVIDACFAGSNLSPTNPACLAIRRNPLDGGLSGDPSTTPGLPITFSNLGRLKTDGVDLVISYRTEFSDDLGYSVSFQGNYTASSEFQATPSAINRDCVGLYSSNCGSIQPKYQWSLRNTLSFNDTDLSLLWRHIDDVRYEDAATAPAFTGAVPAVGTGTFNFNRIPDYDFFDLAARFEANENFTFTFLIENLLDKGPPLVGNNIGSTAFNSGNTYPSTYDTLGRTYTASARIRF